MELSLKEAADKIWEGLNRAVDNAAIYRDALIKMAEKAEPGSYISEVAHGALGSADWSTTEVTQ